MFRYRLSAYIVLTHRLIILARTIFYAIDAYTQHLSKLYCQCLDDTRHPIPNPPPHQALCEDAQYGPCYNQSHIHRVPLYYGFLLSVLIDIE